MQTITSKKLRQNLKQVVNEVSSGQEYELTLGRGSNTKRIKLIPGKETSQKQELFDLLDSPEFKAAKPSKKIQAYENFKDYHKTNFHP